MDIKKSYNKKELLIEVSDHIDTVTAPDFENEIMDEMGKFDSLVLDFEKLEYISSAGLRVLLSVQKKLKPQGIPFIIINANDMIKEIFSVSGFDKYISLK